MKKLLILLCIILLTGCNLQSPFRAGEINEISKTKLIEKYNLATEIKVKYQLDNASLVKTDIKNAELDAYKGEPKDEIKVTIGDKDKAEFVPNIELKRWNEVSFKIKTDNLLKDIAIKDKILTFESDKIKFDTPKMSFEMYDFTEGEEGYKFVWYLNSKPATNKVEFQIESSGLDFFYQPPLTQEYQNGYSEEFQKEIVVTETQVKDLEGNVLVERPENVVGSYAVYHSTKGGMNDVNGKEYKTGKAFHIYRPHIIDANGVETWGILHIENDIYSVEIPQDFLDKAVYPIKSNDTFGYTTAGSLWGQISDNDIIRSLVKISPSNGILNSISTYLSANYDSGGQEWRGGLYDTSGNRLQDSDQGAIISSNIGCACNPSSTSDGAWSISTTTGTTINITNGTIYWITIFLESGLGHQTAWYFWDTGSGTNSKYSNNLGELQFSTWPSPWTPQGQGTIRTSVYATYTPSEGGASIPSSDTVIIVE